MRQRFRRRGRTRLGLLLVIATATLTFAALANATTVNYWGYNNLTKSNPPAGTCPNSAAGIACSGWNYWDYSQVDWNSGRSRFAFGSLCQSDGLIHARLMSGDEAFGVYTVLWSDFCPGHYNKAAVAHVAPINPPDTGHNYLQGRALIF